MEEKIRQYIKDNLDIDWKEEGDRLYLCLILDGEVISRVRFAQD